MKVKGDKSPYDGDLVYWNSRMGKNPELSSRLALLLKKQKGKCSHCEFIFINEDVMEVDHIVLPPPFPDHTQLPEEDGTFVKNFQEHPQSILLTDSISPVLQELHPDGQYAIGQDCGIYWRETEPLER